jgi:rhamnosyl/mannosyltransferase
MACGVPVVSTALATGVPFVNVHGETGVIVPPANPRALAEALFQLLSNDEYRRSLGEKAKQRAHTYFSAERMVSDIKNIYHQVLATSSSE